jgi:hypothetical protein
MPRKTADPADIARRAAKARHKKMRQALRVMAKIMGSEVEDFTHAKVSIICPATNMLGLTGWEKIAARRNLKLQTLGHVYGEPHFRRGTFYELLKSPYMCERVPVDAA